MKKILLIVVIAVSLLYVFPVAYTTINSFMSPQQINQEGLQLIPEDFNIQQYYSIALYKGQYFKFYVNSVFITGVIICGQIVVGVFAAFALAKLKLPGRNLILIIYILAILLPFQVISVPNYLVFDKLEKVFNLKIFDTHWALIFPGIFSSLGVFLLRQFIINIPNEIIESARIDGAGYFKIFFRIILPLIRPAIISLVILTFIDNWNLVEQAIIFISTPEKQPLSVFLESIYYQDNGVFYGGSVLYIIPAVLILIKGEKHLQEGLLLGGIK